MFESDGREGKKGKLSYIIQFNDRFIESYEKYSICIHSMEFLSENGNTIFEPNSYIEVFSITLFNPGLLPLPAGCVLKFTSKSPMFLLPNIPTFELPEIQPSNSNINVLLSKFLFSKTLFRTIYSSLSKTFYLSC